MNNPDHVSLEIYNIKGQKVRTLLNEQREAGDNQVIWDGKDSLGRKMPSGVYLYQMVTDDEKITSKMMMLK